MLLARDALRREGALVKAALLPYALLTELCMHCDISLAYKQLKLRPVYATVLTPFDDDDGGGGRGDGSGGGGGGDDGGSGGGIDSGNSRGGSEARCETALFIMLRVSICREK
eukprot:2708424-Pleurochrysis_carterae.AAC.1